MGKRTAALAALAEQEAYERFRATLVRPRAPARARSRDDLDEWEPKQTRHLGCPLLGVSYWHPTRTATLRLPPYCCVDMTGAIEFVVKRFPAATSIKTMAGDALDICYARTGGAWQVSCCP